MLLGATLYLAAVWSSDALIAAYTCTRYLSTKRTDDEQPKGPNTAYKPSGPMPTSSMLPAILLLKALSFAELGV